MQAISLAEPFFFSIARASSSSLNLGRDDIGPNASQHKKQQHTGTEPD
jgi:hypothetical protein